MSISRNPGNPGIPRNDLFWTCSGMIWCSPIATHITINVRNRLSKIMLIRHIINPKSPKYGPNGPFGGFPGLPEMHFLSNPETHFLLKRFWTLNQRFWGSRNRFQSDQILGPFLDPYLPDSPVQMGTPFWTICDLNGIILGHPQNGLFDHFWTGRAIAFTFFVLFCSSDPPTISIVSEKGTFPKRTKCTFA